jgi:hypothetical protein
MIWSYRGWGPGHGESNTRSKQAHTPDATLLQVTPTPTSTPHQTHNKMKLLNIASALFAASASAGSIFGGQAVALDDSLSVPGNNPLNHCADPKDDILDLKSVDLNPNPPKA